MISKNTKDSLKKAIEDDQKLISLGNIEKTKEIFKRNCKLLKSIIKNEGWPPLEEDNSPFHNAWLIAQHSDHDPLFQLQCLGLIMPEINNDKEIIIDCAFLLDRILINLKRKQIFGTQLGGKIEKPITFSPLQLGDLRNKIGLESIEEYLEDMRKYSKKNNP